ncbi:hypothetical protein KIN20_003231 [Parelaphostrongylus tenuis]|uniref:Secreted protein n=1 Tax=Parelaphostrongylus tenuis TaxID=148309 RepID=A0AAD5LYU7_PARTN|nr:hypothetical protein KIN20_003231 [Parelaphostrongylus tenuis]
MATFPTSCKLMILMLTFATVLGCGVMPPGQASTRNFTVSGFTLPVNMIYSNDATVRSKAFGIAASSGEVQALVSRLVMQTVFNVLEQQGRGALLPDAAISAILGQLTVRVTYEPLECKDVEKDPTLAARFGMMMKDPHCIIIGNTVTSICTGMLNNDCRFDMPMKIKDVPAAHKSISGTLRTTNIIMASWSRQMWQSVVNRAVRTLALGPFRSHFLTAFATVG